MTLPWEVNSGALDQIHSRYFATAGEALEFCGQELYGRKTSEVLFLLIRNRASGDAFLENCYVPQEGENPMWILQSRRENVADTCRRLEATHELFAMLVAEIRLGAQQIVARHRCVAALM